MKHFLEISQLSAAQIDSLLQRALFFKQKSHHPSYPQHTVAQLFYEPSTRTRVSFELAAHRLSMNSIHLDLNSSSETKGEIIEDTLDTLAAMGIEYFVIRHQHNGVLQHLANHVGDAVHLINAGDGTHAHPSQGILDMLTIMEEKPDLGQLKIAIVGDISHSRVANSFQWMCRQLGVGELRLIAPKLWQPQTVHYGQVTEDLAEGLADVDVVMCLRVQRERLTQTEYLDLESYRRDFAVTAKSLAYAKPDAMLMHPGPLNRGVELDSEVADGAQSFILKQVSNGVFARMAIYDALIKPM